LSPAKLPAFLPDWHQSNGILMEKYATELKLLVELDQRHDELLEQLDDLDKQVAAVLAQWTAQRDTRREAA